MSENELNGRVLQGKVVSTKMNNTIVVLVNRRVKHPMYKKVITRSTKLHVHAANEETSVGDIVQVQECPRISKTKSWKLLSIVEKAS